VSSVCFVEGLRSNRARTLFTLIAPHCRPFLASFGRSRRLCGFVLRLEIVVNVFVLLLCRPLLELVNFTSFLCSRGVCTAMDPCSWARDRPQAPSACAFRLLRGGCAKQLHQQIVCSRCSAFCAIPCQIPPFLGVVRRRPSVGVFG
jgi:hypothetical protein